MSIKQTSLSITSCVYHACVLCALAKFEVAGGSHFCCFHPDHSLRHPPPQKRGVANEPRVYVPTASERVALCRREAEGKRTAGVSWQNNSYYEMLGLHFNSGRPCQGHHMPARLPGLLETRRYWTKAAALERHTQQLFSATAHHLMTLVEGRATHD